jgi:hypothetical protein
MRTVLIALLAAGGLGLGSVTASAASSQPVSGKFTVHFPKAGQQNNVYPCPADVFCGVGTLRGFGAAELDVFDSNFQPIEGTNCLSFDKEDDVRLLDSGDTLVVVGSGSICFPGNSGNVPGNSNNSDYGHPSHWVSQLTVDGASSSGVFRGATGTVTETFTAAGGAGVWGLTGSITGA